MVCRFDDGNTRFEYVEEALHKIHELNKTGRGSFGSIEPQYVTYVCASTKMLAAVCDVYTACVLVSTDSPFELGLVTAEIQPAREGTEEREYSTS